MSLLALPTQDEDPQEGGAPHSLRGPGGCCPPAPCCLTLGPHSPSSLSKTALEGPEPGRTSEGKQAVKYFKTWYFTRNSPSEGPKIHSSVFALKRVGGPAQGSAARSFPSQQGKGKQPGCVWGHLTEGFSDWGWRRREGGQAASSPEHFLQGAWRPWGFLVSSGNNLPGNSLIIIIIVPSYCDALSMVCSTPPPNPDEVYSIIVPIL